MTIDFAGVKSLTIPEGSVSKIIRKRDNTIIWEKGALPQKDTLENTSWADIRTISRAGLASTYWSIGDQKTISISGTTYLVDIIGFDHDTPTDVSTYGRNKAGITFQLHDLFFEYYQMNSSNSNEGGWNGSLMRNETMTNELFDNLAADLRNVIVPVDKYTGVGGASSSGTQVSSDNLFLLAEREVFEAKKYCIWDEHSALAQYEYYKNGGSKIKQHIDNGATEWWLRSPRSGYIFYFCSVDESGNADRDSANIYIGVSFAFCV